MKVKGYTRKELLALPVRDWQKITDYDTLTIVPTGQIHKDSGYRLMAIVGNMNDKGPVEIAAFCDDFCWEGGISPRAWVRIDMVPNNNCVHIWSNDVRFRVGYGLSSTSLKVIERAKK